MFKIPKRISMLESMIPYGSICADIGTDHGYLPIALAKANKCKGLIAADISQICLDKAIKNINLQGFTDLNVEYRVGDGIHVLYENDSITHIAIAGMGGRQIIEMLSDVPAYLQNATFLLQPMQNIIELRQSFDRLGFAIINEELIYENNRFFEIIEIHKRNTLLNNLFYNVDTQLDAILGPCIISQKHPLLLKRLNEVIDTYLQALRMIEKAAVTHESSIKADGFREIIEILRGLMYELQHSDDMPMD